MVERPTSTLSGSIGERRSTGMSGHERHGRGQNIWLTPPSLIKAFGPFDLDPCFGPPRPWNTAARHFGPVEDGLRQAWHGFVWLNPSYDHHAEKWLNRLADHGHGIALIFARTETKAFFSQVWTRATAVLFLRGRLHFHRQDGSRASTNSGAPSVLIGYGAEAVRRLEASHLEGQLIRLKQPATSAADG
ncbi:MAG: DNA N-6-adenine-methyltransferase [Pseudomonadota bacterium]